MGSNIQKLWVTVRSAVRQAWLATGAVAFKCRGGSYHQRADNAEEGLAQMAKAYKFDPDNSEYRVQYFKRREALVFKWLSLAEAAKGKAAWDEAEGLYQRILKIDVDNSRAKTGLSSLAAEKKQAQLLGEAKLQLEKNDIAGAAKNVRTVLAETPSHFGALALRKTIESKTVLANQSGSIFKSKLTRPITIEFKDAPVMAVFDSISRIAGINIIFDKEVRSTVRRDHSPNRVELQGLLDYKNIQIHNGSYPRNFKGCFGAGTSESTDLLRGTKDAMSQINGIINADGSGKITVNVGAVQ